MKKYLLVFLFAALNIQSSKADDPGYRVGVATISHEVELPSHSDNWQLQYKFKVPPKPSDGWVAKSQTVYTYGQVDFDMYGASGKYKISSYETNQIVPQVMIGKCLDANNSDYKPAWHVYEDWIIQAQYYWREDKTSYAMCGNIIHVNPDEEITTIISYDASTGVINVSIANANETSSISIERPFPNQPDLFTSWTSFFEQAESSSKSKGVYGKPVLNVESHYVDEKTLCSILPFNVSYVEIPGVAWERSNYKVYPIGKYQCSNGLAGDLAILNF